MIEVVLAVSPGASEGMTKGDWIIQASPVLVSLIAAATAFFNMRSSNASKNDPLKKALAAQLKSNERIIKGILERFDSLTGLLKTSMEKPSGRSSNP